MTAVSAFGFDIRTCLIAGAEHGNQIGVAATGKKGAVPIFKPHHLIQLSDELHLNQSGDRGNFVSVDAGVGQCRNNLAQECWKIQTAIELIHELFVGGIDTVVEIILDIFYEAVKRCASV